MEEFVTDLTRAGFRWDAEKLRIVGRTFCRRFDTPAGWLALPLRERLGLPEETRVVVSWCLCTHRLRGAEVIDYLLAGRHLGQFAARLDTAFHARFTAMAATIATAGNRRLSRDWTARQWRTLTRLSIVAGVPADQLSLPQLEAARLAVWQALREAGQPVMANMLIGRPTYVGHGT